jgi:HEAT repeat protein
MSVAKNYLSAIEHLVGHKDEEVKSGAATILAFPPYETSGMKLRLPESEVSRISRALAHLLRDGGGGSDFGIRAAAADVAGHLGPNAATPEAVSGLARLLADYKKIEYPSSWDETVRNTVLSAVARLGPKAASPEMAASLAAIFLEPGGGIKSNEVEAIGSVYGADPPPELISALGLVLANPLKASERAVSLVAELGPIAATPEHIAALARMLESGHHQLAVLEALERLGKAAATAGIVAALNSTISEADRDSQSMRDRLERLQAEPVPYYVTESGRESYSALRMSLGHHETIRARARSVLRIMCA